MSSILTNNGAATALQTMRNINDNLSETQARISTGLQVRSGKDNAAYFSISKTMGGDSQMYKAIQEGMTLTKNTVSTSRMGAEKVAELSEEFASRVALLKVVVTLHSKKLQKNWLKSTSVLKLLLSNHHLMVSR